MTTLGKLRKQANNGPKWVVKVDGLDLYVANDPKNIFGCLLVENPADAIQYSVDFDPEQMKLGYWNAFSKLNNMQVTFTAMHL